LAPEWAKAATALKGSPMKLAKVDATENRELAEKYGIRGFPTIKYFKEGKFMSDYSGGRKDVEIVAWANKKTGPATVTITTVEEFRNLEKSENVFALGVFKSLDSEIATLYSKMASDDERIVYALTTSSAIMTELSLEKDTIVVIKSFDDKRADLEVTPDITVAVIKSFLVGESAPLIQEFTQESAKTIFASPIQQHALFFTKKGSSHHEAVTAAMKEVAKANKGRMLVVNVPSTEAKVAEFFGVTEDAMPKLFIADMGASSGLMKYGYTGDLTSSAEIASFADSFFAGSLTPTLKSEDVAPDDTKGPVVVVKGKSFEDLVINNTKDVFFEMYAPWCGHCKKLAPILDELGTRYADNANVMIAKMDATANEINFPGMAVQGFPTMFFFKGNDKTKAIKYEGGRDLSDLISYLEENAHHISGSSADEL
jgi:protein disulfide-isomerase A1